MVLVRDRRGSALRGEPRRRSAEYSGCLWYSLGANQAEWKLGSDSLRMQ